MKKPHHVKAYTIKGHFVKGHEQKAKWVKKHWAKPVHVKGHMVGKPYVTKKVVKTTHKPTAKQLGRGSDLGMCAVTAAGLVAGVSRVNLTDLYMTLSPFDTGVTIPDAMFSLGLDPIESEVYEPGVILGLPNHAVVIDTVLPEGLKVAQWGELHFMSWEYVNSYGEEAWTV